MGSNQEAQGDEMTCPDLRCSHSQTRGRTRSSVSDFCPNLRPCCSPPSQEAHFHVFTIGLNSCLRETSRVLVNEHVQSLVLMPNKLFHFEYLPAWWRWRNPLKDRLPLSFRTLHAQKTIDWDFQKYLPVSSLWDFHSAGLSSLVLSQSLPYSGTKVFAGKRHEKGISILQVCFTSCARRWWGHCAPAYLLISFTLWLPSMLALTLLELWRSLFWQGYVIYNLLCGGCSGMLWNAAVPIF